MGLLRLSDFDLLNSGFSGALLLLTTVGTRLLLFRPRLKLSFDVYSEDLQRFIESRNKESIDLQTWVRLRLRNYGLLKLTNPKVICVKVSSQTAQVKNEPSITPFELSWSESADNGEMSVVFPGDFEYRFDLAWLKWGEVVPSNSPHKVLSPAEFYLARKDRMKGRKFPLGVEHEVLIIVGNDNFLVPSYFAILSIYIDVLDESKLPQEEGLSVRVQKLKDGDWYWWPWR